MRSAEDQYIRNRVNLPTGKSSAEIARDIPAGIRAKSFFSARMAEAHVLERFRTISDDYNTGKIGRDEARHLMLQYARQHGKDDGTEKLRNLGSTARLNLIIDQNAKMAHAVGTHERMYSPAALRIYPSVRYHASVGSRHPRGSHGVYDGNIYRKDDPWLKTHTPPWDFGCNCELEQITEKQAMKTPARIKSPQAPSQVKVEAPSGYAFNPADAFEAPHDLTSLTPASRKAILDQAADAVRDRRLGTVGMVSAPHVTNLPPVPVAHEADVQRQFNAMAQAALEGFNKWAAAGIKLFVTSDLRHFTLPDSLRMRSTYNEHNLSVGGSITKRQGRTLHYDVTAETWISGEDAGMLHVDGNADMNFKLFGDTLRLDAGAFIHRNNPSFYYRHYQGAHAWWHNDLEKEIHTHLEGSITYPKTETTLRAAVDYIKNYSYLANSYTVDKDLNRQNYRTYVKTAGDDINVITLSLDQRLHYGIFHWDNVLTFQKSNNDDVLPLPTFNLYSNLYMQMRIAKVLRLQLGADMRYFTKYTAPDYNPYMGQFAVQDVDDKIEIGGYPFINVYANMHLKRTRFFIMYSHINVGSGSSNYFLSPHYPANGGVLRFGLSWNFIN